MTQKDSHSSIRIENIVLPVLLVSLAGVAAMVLSLEEVQIKYQTFLNLGTLLLVVLCVVILFGIVHQIRVIHGIITSGLALNVVCGLLLLFALTSLRSGTIAHSTIVDLTMALPPILTLIVLMAMIITNLPAMLYGLMILYVGCLVLVPVSGFRSMDWHSTDIFLPNQFQISNNIIFLFLILFGLAYFPRNLQWKQYIWPRSVLRPYDPPSRREEGFTLIELLIVVAILSIVTTGAMQAWVQGVHSQQALEQRITISRILSSEMEAMAARAVLPSTGTQPLPISLDSFPAPKDLQGEVLTEAAETPGLVKVTVLLHHGLRPEEQQHYRLTAWQRGER